jgi:hypothetical protein
MGVEGIIAPVTALLSVGIVAGLVVRHRIGVCLTFVPYLIAVALADLLVLLWPGYFYKQWFWLGSQNMNNVLRFAVALELTYRTFRAFPAARGTARFVLLLVLLATLGLVVGGTQDAAPVAGGPSLAPMISRVQPRILNGTIWLLTAVAALILWYRLPVHPFHKAILTGLVPYLLIFTTALNLLETQGWQIREDVNYLYTGAYCLLLIFWAWAAWRRVEAPVRAPEADGPDGVLRRVPG